MHPHPIEPDAFPAPGSRLRIDFSDQPVIALIYGISGALMEMIGLMFWAALIVLFIQAELFSR